MSVPSPSAGRAWAVVALMWVAYVLNYTDRQVVFSIFPVLKAELGFTDKQCGLTGSIFLWIYALCSPLAGVLGDRMPRRTLIVWSLILWSGMTAMTGACRSPVALLVCRGLMGVAESVFFPSAIALTAEAHPPSTRSRAVAFFSTGQLVGVVLGGWYGGFMAERHHWREAFYSLGVVGAAYAAPYAFLLRQGPGAGPAQTAASIETRPSIGSLFRIPMYRVLCAAFPSFTFILWLLYTWLADVVHEKFGLPLDDAGFVSTAYLQALTLGGIVLGGVLADHLRRSFPAARFWIVAAGLLICGPGVHFVGNAGSLPLMKVAMAAFGLGGGLVVSNVFASCFDVVPAAARATAAGILNLLGGFISGFASLLGGVLKKSIGFSGLTTVVAILALAMAALLLAGTRRFFLEDFQRAQEPA